MESQKELMDQAAASSPEKKFNSRMRNLPPADMEFDYKNPDSLRQFIADGGKITPARTNRLNRKQQSKMNHAIKRARILALLPFCDSHHR